MDPLLQFAQEFNMLAVKFQWAVERHLKECQCKNSTPIITINIDPEVKLLPEKRKQLKKPVRFIGPGYQQ